jgi:hypothetical protein
MIAAGDIIKFRNVRVRVRRVAIINGEPHYYIKLPFRAWSFAMLSEKDLTINRKARII